VRSGNVMGSRGSVIPLFIKQREQGSLTVTDPRMTRFWLTLDQGVNFVIRSIERMQGGEVFVPKIPSMNIMDLAQAVAPECPITSVGIRPGEKLHEVMISEDEARHSLELDDMFVVQPVHPWWGNINWQDGRALPDGFSYSSDTNGEWLNIEQLRGLIEDLA
jgi:FlaA1/EpsC-like NDP-sugar epimerase